MTRTEINTWKNQEIARIERESKQAMANAQREHERKMARIQELKAQAFAMASVKM